MPDQPYYPRRQPEQIVWLNNYKVKIAIHGTTVGLSAGDITATQADLTFYIWLLEVWYPQVEQDLREATAYKKLVANGGVPNLSPIPVPVGTVFPSPPAPPPQLVGILKRLFLQIAHLKTHAGYNETIGQDLKIIGTESEAEHPVPEFKTTVEDGPECQCARLDFIKHGHDGVYIESRRNGGPWEFLAIDTRKPYLDARPLLVSGQAEMREYRMRFWDGGEPNGDWTPVQKVSVGV